jgi:chaperonin GroES
MNIKPLNDRVVLQAMEVKNQTASGIYIPEASQKERPFVYDVIAVGPGKKDALMNVSVGQKVLCGQYA